VLRWRQAQKYAAFRARNGFLIFLEAAGNFLMQTGLIETMREKLRGVSIFTASRPSG
jgi:hypothetical protein